MSGSDRIEQKIRKGGSMKMLWLSNLFIAAAICLLTTGMASAAPMVTIGACTDCHGTDPSANVSPVESTTRNSPGRAVIGTHVAHVTTNGMTCVACHTVPGAAAFDHRNGKIDMQSSISSGSYSLGTAVTQDNQTALNTPNSLGTCSTTTCHGTSSPQWGANTTDASCVKCHGVAGTSQATYNSTKPALAAPGYSGTGRDTGGSSSSSDTEVGTHDSHLRALSNYSDPIACTECHSNTNPDSASFTGHMNGSGTLSWGTLAQTGGKVPNWDSGAHSCGTTYCHDKQANGSGRSPVWNNTAYLSGIPSSAECGLCHGAPPLTSAHIKTQPSTYYVLSECRGCHDHVNTDGSFTAGANRSKHINGTVEGGGCSGCHSYDTSSATFSAGVWTGGTWGTGVSRDGLTPGEGWGAHAKHINHLKTRLGYNTTTKILAESAFGTGDAAIICGTCHTNTGAHDTGGNTTGRLINFGDGAYKAGGASGFSFLFDPAATVGLPTNTLNRPNYNGIPGTSSSVTQKTCSNISCHFSTTPLWSSY